MKEKVKDILRTHVHKHEYPVDPAEIWAGVQSEIEGDNKKDKRRFFAIFFSLGAIALIALLTINLGQGDSNQFSDISTQMEGERQVETRTKNESNNQKENIELSQNAQEKTNNDSQKRKIKNSNSVPQATVVQGNINELAVSKFSIEKNEVGISKPSAFNKFKIGINNSNNIENELTVPLGNTWSLGAKKRLNSDSGANESDDYNSNVSEESDVVFEERPSLEVLNGIGFLGNKMISGIERSPLLIGSENFSKIELAKMRSHRSTISVLAGTGVFTKKIVAFDESHKAYANGRESYEKPLELISAQALISIPLVSNLTLSTGIQYLQFNEELEWTGSYFINGSGDIFPAPVENLVGENYYQEINYSLLNYNQSRLFSVPVLIGYTVQKKRLTYGVKAGVNFQLQTQTFGKVFNEDLIPINTLNHKFDLGLQCKFEMGYFIIPGLELFSELSVLQVDTIEEIVNQRFRSYSLGLGLRQSL